MFFCVLSRERIKNKIAPLFAAGAISLALAACEEAGAPFIQGEPISAVEWSEGEIQAGKGETEKKDQAADGEDENRELINKAISEEEEQEKGEVTARVIPVLSEAVETLETRVLAPSGYERVEALEGSFAEFVRQYPMKPAGEKVHLYDGSEKGNQSAHVAIFDLPIEEYDLQQCADSVMRMYAEYFWATEQYDRIKFHFTNGFLAEYSKWREGSRVTVNGNNVSWIKSKTRDASYECFVRYLRTIFCYAGTLSMEKESEATTMKNLKAGDVFLHGGSPGHVVMVADVCENAEGKKAFLLSQGYMPAQEFQLLKNPRHPEDPWYYEDEVTYPFQTPEYVFDEGSLRSLKY